MALGVGALALLIVGLASWDGFDRPTLSGHILLVGPAALPPQAVSADDIGAFSLYVLDARERLFTTATTVAAIQPG